MRNILIIKFGALGDVVRTSYFARELKNQNNDIKLFWITSEASVPLLSGNPYINILTSSFGDLKGVHFDRIYSLDDELNILLEIKNLHFSNLSGAYIEGDKLQYTKDVSEWFDMGLLSVHGKEVADKLKKRNIRSHGEIFKKIFSVSKIDPNFYYPIGFNKPASLIERLEDEILIGINPYAGVRWPSKELDDLELENLIRLLLQIDFEGKLKIILLGSRGDKDRNILIQSKIGSKSVFVANTDRSLLDFAFQIKQLNYLITSDSLALHLSLSQGVRSTAFFAPTSAAEIDSFGICDKVVSLSNDYCSYLKICSNTTITAKRLISSFYKNFNFEAA